MTRDGSPGPGLCGGRTNGTLLSDSAAWLGGGAFAYCLWAGGRVLPILRFELGCLGRRACEAHVSIFRAVDSLLSSIVDLDGSLGEISVNVIATPSLNVSIEQAGEAAYAESLRYVADLLPSLLARRRIIPLPLFCCMFNPGAADARFARPAPTRAHPLLERGEQELRARVVHEVPARVLFGRAKVHPLPRERGDLLRDVGQGPESECARRRPRPRVRDDVGDHCGVELGHQRAPKLHDLRRGGERRYV